MKLSSRMWNLSWKLHTQLFIFPPFNLELGTCWMSWKEQMPRCICWTSHGWAKAEAISWAAANMGGRQISECDKWRAALGSSIEFRWSYDCAPCFCEPGPGGRAESCAVHVHWARNPCRQWITPHPSRRDILPPGQTPLCPSCLIGNISHIAQNKWGVDWHLETPVEPDPQIVWKSRVTYQPIKKSFWIIQAQEIGPWRRLPRPMCLWTVWSVPWFPYRTCMNLDSSKFWDLKKLWWIFEILVPACIQWSNTFGPLYPWILHLWIQPTMDQKYLKKKSAP